MTTPSLTNPNPKREDEATETELRHALFRLKTECEVEGLDLKPGFDAWVSWANKLLGDFRPSASARPSPGGPVRAALEGGETLTEARLARLEGWAWARTDGEPLPDDGNSKRQALNERVKAARRREVSSAIIGDPCWSEGLPAASEYNFPDPPGEVFRADLSVSTPTGEGEATGTQTVPDRMSVAYWHRLQADELQQRAGENDTAWIIRLRQHFASSETEEEEA